MQEVEVEVLLFVCVQHVYLIPRLWVHTPLTLCSRLRHSGTPRRNASHLHILEMTLSNEYVQTLGPT